jgi:phosphatidylglycerophosphatase A
MNTRTDAIAAPAPGKKPLFAFAVATVLGVGYLKPAPGTWGSLIGLALAVVSHPFTWFLVLGRAILLGSGTDAPLLSGPWGTALLLIPSIVIWLVVAWLGVWSSTKVAVYSGIHDPQFVVIDEVSGVQLALILGLAPLAAPASLFNSSDAAAFALYSGMSILNWKYLLAGFVLFRIFDIAKPFPCRRLEKLPGGWGVMADDWMAGVYAAICMRLALHFDLLSRHVL